VKIAVLGVGLIGGSIGLAARRCAGAQVCGYDPNARACSAALQLGAIDVQASDIASAVSGADAVFAAAPVGVLSELVREALDAAGPECVVSDVGSTKRVVADFGRDQRFIGGHPLTGAESSGVEHARGDLFEGATWYLTPTQHTAEMHDERLRGLVASFGAQPVAIQADAHDRLMACISHLPHVLANLLAGQAVSAFDREHCAPASGPSMRDAIRVAGANSAIWTDIYLANREELIAAVDEASSRLTDVRAALTGADADALIAWNEQARADRETLLDEHPGRAS